MIRLTDAVSKEAIFINPTAIDAIVPRGTGAAVFAGQINADTDLGAKVRHRLCRQAARLSLSWVALK